MPSPSREYFTGIIPPELKAGLVNFIFASGGLVGDGVSVGVLVWVGDGSSVGVFDGMRVFVGVVDRVGNGVLTWSCVGVWVVPHPVTQITDKKNTIIINNLLANFMVTAPPVLFIYTTG
jgi:hypothetical protein